MAESEKDRKKRLEAQRKAAKKKPAKKAAAPKKAAAKKAAPAAPKPRLIGPSENSAIVEAPKTGNAWKEENAEKNVAFEVSQKERDINEIGNLDEEATPAQRKAREEQRKKYEGQLREVPVSETPKNVVDTTEDPLRPRMEEVDTPPTPAQAAARAAKTAPGVSGTGIYTFDAPRAVQPPTQDVEELAARRSAKGLPGLPGDENGVNALALGLAKRDYAIAKESKKTVNEMDPEGDEPTHIDQIYYGHHRRLADVMLAGGLSEDHISKAAQGTGTTTVGKVKYLHSLLKAHRSARDVQPINLEKEGITHWIHPTTGVAHPIAANHPDMPKTQPIHVPGGEGVGHGFWRGGKEQRVRKDQNTGSWVIDKNTGNADIDSTLGWNPDKEVGYYTVTLRGGIKALKQNVPPASGRSLWEHEVNNMKSEFPASVSVDSRLQHKAYANRILEDAAKSEVDGKVLARNRAGEPIAKVKRRGGKIVGAIVGTGRTRQRGFTVDETGETVQTTGISTSRARTTREGAPFPTRELGDSGYSEGGSIRVDETTDMPERVKVVEFQNKKRRTKKSAVVGGRKVTVPPQRGLLVQKREKAVLPQPKVGKQFEPVIPPPPLPSWHTDLNVTPEYEPDITKYQSTAEPITKPHISFTKRVIPDPKAVKKNPKTKKTKTVYDKHVGMVDQMIPGFEKAGVTEVPERPAAPSRQFRIVEGPITAGQAAAEQASSRNSAIPEIQKLRGKVSYVEPAETPIAESTPTVSKQLEKIPGNKPVEQPATPAPAGPAKTVRVYGSKKKKMVEATPAPAAPEQPKEEPEQLAFPGMEDVASAHAEGQQWLRTRNLSAQTRELQGRAGTAGVPGGANPITVTRGNETPKSTRSHK